MGLVIGICVGIILLGIGIYISYRVGCRKGAVEVMNYVHKKQLTYLESMGHISSFKEEEIN